MGRKSSLTEKQRKFVDEYLIDLNATKAASRAGYSEKTAASQGERLLRNVEIQQLLSERIEARSNRTEITQDRVLREYAKLAFFDPRRLFSNTGEPIPIHELDDDTASVIAGLDVHEEYLGSGEDRVFVGYTKKYKLSDKKGALDSLARHLGMFSDKRDDPVRELTLERMRLENKRLRHEVEGGSGSSLMNLLVDLIEKLPG